MSDFGADVAEIRTIADYIRQGRCVLFLGAAVHAPPPDGSPYVYPDTERPASAYRLTKQLTETGGFAKRFFNDKPPDELQRIALAFEIQNSRHALVDQIRRAVHDNKRPSPVVRALARLNFPLVITTNYDQLFEQALHEAGKDPFVSVYKSNVTNVEATDAYPYLDDPTVQRPFVLKLHGDVVRGTQSIVITEEDYIQFVMRMTESGIYAPIPDVFRYRFKTWPTLFIGYSLRDYNLRLLFKTLRWGLDLVDIPPMYSVDRSPDPLVLDVWQNRRRHVTFVVQDVWKFIPALYREIMQEDMP